MLIIVDPNSGVPAYRQLMEQIRFQVSTGVLLPGTELPSTRALSQELGLNPMTVSKSYSLLEQEGLLERRPGLPLVVSNRSKATLEHEKLGRLKTVLEPAATAATQLGVKPATAAGLFKTMITTATRKSETGK